MSHTPTPGPWNLGPKHKDGSYAIHADKASIAHVVPFVSSFKEWYANARLIAAAPELLEACRRIVLETTDDLPPTLSAVRQCADAIAKAIGEANEGL